MNETENKAPVKPLSAIYADAEQTITLAVRNVVRAYPLPIFMIKNILQGITREYELEASRELAAESEAYQTELKEYYEKREKDLIASFEQAPEGKEE